MKVKFFQRLNTRLSLFPLFIMLTGFIAVGISFYIFGYSHFLKDFHKLHLINLSSDKKLILDSWFEGCKTELDDLSRMDMFRNSAAILMKDIQKSSVERQARGVRRTMYNARRMAYNEAQLNISRLFEKKASSKKYNVLCLLSMDGRVISSSRNDIVGADWSDRMSLKEMTPVLKSTTVAGLGADNVIDFITPVFDAQDNIIAILYVSARVDALAGFLKIKNGLYKSEKIELIDRDGNIVLTREGASAKKIRYNIPEDSQNIVRYKDGIFFYVADLEQSPFRLIATVQKSEVARPFTILLIMYLSFVGMVILLSVIQNAHLAKRLITRPLMKFTHAIRSVAAGDLSVDLGKDYRGEFLEMKKSFENMIEELRERESNLRESIRAKEQARLFDIFQEEFNMCELLREIEDDARSLIGTKEVELIVDCQDVFKEKPLHADRYHLKQILNNLVINAVKSTEVGTVTILSSETIKNGVQYIEVSVADTGAGIEPEKLNSIFDEFSDYPIASNLFISKKLTEALGGRIDVESTPGKGSVFTVTIPVKAITYQ